MMFFQFLNKIIKYEKNGNFDFMVNSLIELKGVVVLTE